jgi:hypothetical protein
MALRDQLRRLERDAGGGMVSIPQRDGTPARFPATALQEAFLINTRRLRGEAVPPHALAVAAAQSPDPEWSRSMYSADWVTIVTPPEDLSEP